jgi:hypothetical protein
MMTTDWVDEYAMAAEISKAEALEPRSLAEARRRPDGLVGGRNDETIQTASRAGVCAVGRSHKN